MVLEQLLDKSLVTKHAPFSFILTFVYTLIAYGVQQAFFPGQSLAIALLLTILLVPSLHHLIIVEEKLERKGSSRFWKRHRTIIKSYLGAFLGLLAGFLLLGFVNATTLDYQTEQLENSHLKPELIENFAAYQPDLRSTIALFSHNLSYLVIGFLLSIFYGAGAIFLITYNASLFAAFIVEIMGRWGVPRLAWTSLVHLLPESTAFILTAIAGATLSRAIIHEKLRTKHFKNVVQNTVKLLGTALVLLAIAAVLEVYVTAPVFQSVV